jgi:hypothetical protein
MARNRSNDFLVLRTRKLALRFDGRGHRFVRAPHAAQPVPRSAANNRAGKLRNHTRTYRLDAKVLQPEKRAKVPTPELERETHDILSRAVEDLKERTFQVTRIDPLRAPDGSVVYYDVTVHLLTERFASSQP